MTPSQSWLFLFLVFYSLSITAYAYWWRNRYYDAESYRLYVNKQTGYKRTKMDDIYSQSFMKE